MSELNTTQYVATCTCRLCGWLPGGEPILIAVDPYCPIHGTPPQVTVTAAVAFTSGAPGEPPHPATEG